MKTREIERAYKKLKEKFKGHEGLNIGLLWVGEFVELLSPPEKKEEGKCECCKWDDMGFQHEPQCPLFRGFEKEEPTQEFTKEELKYLRQVVDVEVTLSERVGEKRITDMAKKVLSKIERLLK